MNFQRLSLLCLLSGLFLFSGCLKDKVTHSYKIFTPVYKLADQVRADIKSEAPHPIHNAGKLFVRGNYIFVNEIDKGVHIIDNSNPASPQNVAFIDIPGNLDLAVKGNILYADLFTDLVALDISNPLDSKVKKIIRNAFPERIYSNGFRPSADQFVVDWIVRDTTVSADFTPPSWTTGCPSCSIWSSFAPAQSGMAFDSKSVGVAGSTSRFSLVNDNLYSVSSTTLNVYNVAAAEDPKFVKNAPIGMGIETLFPFKDKLFIGSTSGVFIYDISAPESPARMGQFGHVTACDPVITNGNLAFVTLSSGVRCSNASNQLDVLDVSNVSSPYLIKTYSMKSPKGLSLDNNLLFICDDGVKVYNISDPKNLKLVEQKSGFESSDIITISNLAIVVTKDNLLQYSYTSDGALKLLSTTYWDN